MALKALMLRKKIDEAKKTLEELRAKDAEFETREAELEQSIEEAETDEEKAVVEEEVEAFEKEKAEHEEKTSELSETIAGLESELEEEERSKKVEKPEEKKEERKEAIKMENRTKFFGMTMQERDAFFENERVKEFLSEVRTCIKEKRALTNVGLTIPEVMLPLLKQVTNENSKLMSKVTVRSVNGTAREVIQGSYPEAVWTEMCANLNELSLAFNDVEVDGYKVGGYFAVCNATLEDNDINLASEILTALGVAIGKALDKAIVYGTGTHMPLGIVTRLAQTAEPASYPTTARTWEDLHTSNVKTGTGATGLNLFKEIVGHTDAIDNDYYDGDLIWMMNKKTHNALTVQSMDKNLNAAIVAGIGTSMPVIGGDIVELSFIPDNNIVFGYPEAYLLAERAGTQLGQSEHVKFLNDQTCFKGTARYDGTPVIAEAFGVCTITTTAPTTAYTNFPQDTANA